MTNALSPGASDNLDRPRATQRRATPSAQVSNHPMTSTRMPMGLSDQEERAARLDELELRVDGLTVVPAQLSLRSVVLDSSPLEHEQPVAGMQKRRIRYFIAAWVEV